MDENLGQNYFNMKEPLKCDIISFIYPNFYARNIHMNHMNSYVIGDIKCPKHGVCVHILSMVQLIEMPESPLLW